MRILSTIKTCLADILCTACAEARAIIRDEGVLLFVVALPLFYPILYSWIYNNEVTHQVPVAVVDASHASTSRKFVRMYDASPDVRVAYFCNSLDEARRLVASQEVNGIVYLPEDMDTRLNRMQPATVSIYCDMSLMLAYKAIYSTATSVAGIMNSRIQIRLSGNATDREDQISTQPLKYEEVPMFNPTGGYGNFILPGVLALILQQTLLLGIGMLYATRNERRQPFAPACGTAVGHAFGSRVFGVGVRANDTSRAGRHAGVCICGGAFIFLIIGTRFGVPSAFPHLKMALERVNCGRFERVAVRIGLVLREWKLWSPCEGEGCRRKA